MEASVPLLLFKVLGLKKSALIQFSVKSLIKLLEKGFITRDEARFQ